MLGIFMGKLYCCYQCVHMQIQKDHVLFDIFFHDPMTVKTFIFDICVHDISINTSAS